MKVASLAEDGSASGWQSLVFRLGLDRWLYRIWRLNPHGLFLRYQQRRFDRANNVQTSGYDDLRYEPTPTSVFDRLMASIQVDFEETSFIDIGSGKAKVLLLAARYPFRKIIGIEKYEDLHRLGEDNLGRASLSGRRCAHIETHCIDACDFEFPNEPTLLYFFNPFPLEVLRQVLTNLEASLRRAPRALTVVFYAPILKRGTPWDRRKIFDDSPLLEIAEETRTYTIYRSTDS